MPFPLSKNLGALSKATIYAKLIWSRASALPICLKPKGPAMFFSPLKRLLVCAALSALALSATLANAQGFPTKPILLINPYPPGGFADNVARIVAQEAGKIL
eukprot:gene23840-44439_t